MCGIIGICAKDAPQLIEQANHSINHRGPDDEGTFSDERIALGHQRLSILDLSPTGHQPMTSADGDYIMIFNGEIYNHEEIRRSIAHKYTFRSSGDSETLLYGYIEYGAKILNKLNGIFAFAIYQKSTRQLFIARDQMGVKPLYYYQKNNTFLFGSEIKSFINIPNFDKTINYKALVNYLHFLWSPGTETPFEYVKKLLPGHYLELNVEHPQQFKIQKYYEIPFKGEIGQKNEQAWIEELDERLTKAVERQLLSDVPVGFFLSGGLDSSGLVALARKLNPDKKIQCYTIDTETQDMNSNGSENDLPYAIKAAKHLNVDLEMIKADTDILQDFDKMIWHLDEPQGDPSPLNVYRISKKARETGHTVLIGGTGGDDLFSGYRRHQALKLEKYFKKIPAFAGSMIKSASGLINTHNTTIRKLKKVTKHIDHDSLSRLAGYYEWTPLKRNHSLFHNDIKQHIQDHNPSDYLINSLQNIPDEKNMLNHLLYWDMKYFLTDNNLNYTDKLSMATGVEVRVPFLDLELVEFSTRLPMNIKMKGNETKYILKKTMEKYLPKNVIYRPKTGFGAPVRRWVLQGLDEMIKDYLSAESIRKRGIFDEKNIQQLIDDNKVGKIDAAYTIFVLLGIESWFRQFVD